MKTAYQFILPLLALLGVAWAITPVSLQAQETSLDGRWQGIATSQRCALRAKIDVTVANGKLRGKWRISGTARGNGYYGAFARVDADGQISNGIAGGRYEIIFRGDLSKGEGKWRLHDMKQALDAKDRAACGPVVLPDGLCLTHVDYEDKK